MKIYLNDICSLCVWNNSILLVGGKKKIFIINLNNGIILNEIEGHNTVINIKKLFYQS